MKWPRIKLPEMIHSLQRIEFFHEEEEWRGRKTPLLHLLFISQADI